MHVKVCSTAAGMQTLQHGMRSGSLKKCMIISGAGRRVEGIKLVEQ